MQRAAEQTRDTGQPESLVQQPATLAWAHTAYMAVLGKLLNMWYSKLQQAGVPPPTPVPKSHRAGLLEGLLNAQA